MCTAMIVRALLVLLAMLSGLSPAQARASLPGAPQLSAVGMVAQAASEAKRATLDYRAVAPLLNDRFEVVVVNPIYVSVSAIARTHKSDRALT